MYFSFFLSHFRLLSFCLSVCAKNIINCFVHRKSHVKYIKLIHQQNNVLCTKYLCLVSSVYAFVQKWNNCRCHNIDYRQIWHRQNGKFITKSYPLVSRIITYFSSSNQKCSQYCSYFYYCHSHCCNEKIKQKKTSVNVNAITIIVLNFIKNHHHQHHHHHHNNCSLSLDLHTQSRKPQNKKCASETMGIEMQVVCFLIFL